MDENHQDRAKSKLIATGDKLWLPSLSPKDQDRLKRLQKKSLAERMGFAGKTPWDFIQLLLIPLVLAGAGYWVSFTQTQSSLQSSQNQHDTDIQIAADQQRETTLKTYLDDISDLLLNHNLSKSKPGDVVSEVARERTLTTLRRLNADRNRIILQFLQDAHLIGGHNAVIDLSGTNLSGVDLTDANLSGVDLSGATLSGANLSGTTLSGAFLDYARLSRANLSDADLSGATLSGAFLDYARLINANLRRANLSGAFLLNANLSEATLLNANLSGAFLLNANLSGVDLTDANLTDAFLTGADLTGATMPDGSKHP